MEQTELTLDLDRTRKRRPRQHKTSKTNDSTSASELLDDYAQAWWDATLESDCPTMDKFFSAYPLEALGTLAEDLEMEVFENQDKLIALAAYLEKQNYVVPEVACFIPARWDPN